MSHPVLKSIALLALGFTASATAATPAEISGDADARAAALEAKLIAWRRDLHEHPELGNMEFRTSKLVADHLKKLGIKVRTGVAGTGVIGVLQGGKPGPVVALRADMDALPVKEGGDLPFASKATSTYRGQTVSVMHACGHDAHTAILMATAEVLAGMRAQLPGTVVFLFQPAEEGPADFEAGTGRTWGAKAMVEQGALDDPKVDAIFGLHVMSTLKTGELAWRAGPFMASADSFSITVDGKQTHGAMPWAGVDPIVVGAQIVTGLQTIVSRQIDITNQPAIVTLGQIHGGVRFNIIPQTVMMEGTIRTFDGAMRDDIHARIKRTAESIAAGSGATADVKVTKFYDVTVNTPALAEKMGPTLRRVAGNGPWDDDLKPVTGAEDFSEFEKKVPALFLFLGVTPEAKLKGVPANHSPLFSIDETALPRGVRALTHLTIDYLYGESR